jgi:hypothetical protein
MLIIRKEQIRAFERVDMPRFEKEMLKHVDEHFPRHAEVLGAKTVLNVIRHGFDRAENYDFSTRHEVCLFIDMMIMLGSDFDTDPQLPWAADILNDETISDPTVKIEKLYDRVMVYLDHVVGTDGVFPVGPLRKMLEYPIKRLERQLSSDMENWVLLEFKSIWPQKYRAVEEEQLRLLIQNNMDSIEGYGFSGQRAVGFFLILMYLLGHRFYIDPQYELLLKDPDNEEVENETTKFDFLHTTFRTTLTKMLG